MKLYFAAQRKEIAMEDIRLGEVETRFAEIIWESAPLSSGKLVAICAEKLDWKKSTTYTVLKKLCERGFFKNEGGEVKVLITREEYYSRKSEMFVQESFEGSLPAFIAAFTSRRKLSESEIAEIRKMIDGGK